MLKLWQRPTGKPTLLMLAAKILQNHAVAPISRMTMSVSRVASDPSDAPIRLHSTTTRCALKPIRSQRFHRSAAATFPGTTSISHLAMDRWDVVKPSNRPFLEIRQPSDSEDTSVTGLGRLLENPAVRELFTTEAAKYRACVDVAEMLHTVSGGVFRTVLKQLPNLCVALNSLTTEYAKPFVFFDMMLGGGPHSTAWTDHEHLDESERDTINELSTTRRPLTQPTACAPPVLSSTDQAPTPSVISYYWRVY